MARMILTASRGDFAQENDAGKGAEIHKGIGHEVKEDSRSSNIIPCDKGNQDITRMGDARIGEHPFNIGLRDGDDVPEGHRCQGNTHMIIVQSGRKPGRAEKKTLIRAANPAAFTPVAIKAVMDVGAPS